MLNLISFFLQAGPQDNWVMTPDEKARILNVVMSIGIAIALIYVFFKVKQQKKYEKRNIERERKKKALKPQKKEGFDLLWQPSGLVLVQGENKLQFDLNTENPAQWIIAAVHSSGTINTLEWDRAIQALCRKAKRKSVTEIHMKNLHRVLPTDFFTRNGISVRSKKIVKKHVSKGIEDWRIIDRSSFSSIG